MHVSQCRERKIRGDFETSRPQWKTVWEIFAVLMAGQHNVTFMDAIVLSSVVLRQIENIPGGFRRKRWNSETRRNAPNLTPIVLYYVYIRMYNIYIQYAVNK